MKNLISLIIITASLSITIVLSGCTNEDVTMDCYEDDSGDLRTNCATMKGDNFRKNNSLESTEDILL